MRDEPTYSVSRLLLLVALLVGIFVGGIAYARLGMKRSVLISLVLMAVSNFSFAALAAAGVLGVLFALRNRTGSEGFRFYVHDAEHTMLPWDAGRNRITDTDFASNSAGASRSSACRSSERSSP